MKTRFYANDVPHHPAMTSFASHVTFVVAVPSASQSHASESFLRLTKPNIPSISPTSRCEAGEQVINIRKGMKCGIAQSCHSPDNWHLKALFGISRWRGAIIFPTKRTKAEKSLQKLRFLAQPHFDFQLSYAIEHTPLEWLYLVEFASFTRSRGAAKIFENIRNKVFLC